MEISEAKELSKVRSKLIIEYINDILSDGNKLKAKINLGIHEVDGKDMCTADIYVPYKDFERHFNLGITPEYISILHEQLLNDLIPYLDDNFIGVTRFYSLRSNDLLFDGVRVMNIMGSSIMLNMYGIDENISSEYNKKI